MYFNCFILKNVNAVCEGKNVLNSQTTSGADVLIPENKNHFFFPLHDIIPIRLQIETSRRKRVRFTALVWKPNYYLFVLYLYETTLSEKLVRFQQCDKNLS